MVPKSEASLRRRYQGKSLNRRAISDGARERQAKATNRVQYDIWTAPGP